MSHYACNFNFFTRGSTSIPMTIPLDQYSLKKNYFTNVKIKYEFV